MLATIEVEAKTVAKKTSHGGPRPGAGRPKKSERDDVSVKMDRAVISRARFVADGRGIALAEYLSEMIRPIVGKDFERAAKGEGA